MNVKRGREIVVEYERVQLIKKRSSTQLHHCDNCGSIADFVSLCSASSLFDVEAERLQRFISANHCHLMRNDLGNTLICLASLLGRMKIQAEIRRLKT